jgi:predicted transcriptional regulator
LRKVKDRWAIRANLVKRGIRVSDLARQLGVSHAAVSRVIAGQSTSRRIGQALIEAGVPERLLPEYGSNP